MIGWTDPPVCLHISLPRVRVRVRHAVSLSSAYLRSVCRAKAQTGCSIVKTSVFCVFFLMLNVFSILNRRVWLQELLLCLVEGKTCVEFCMKYVAEMQKNAHNPKIQMFGWLLITFKIIKLYLKNWLRTFNWSRDITAFQNKCKYLSSVREITL